VPGHSAGLRAVFSLTCRYQLPCTVFVDQFNCFMHLQQLQAHGKLPSNGLDMSLLLLQHNW
jgi:hypothetical protein